MGRKLIAIVLMIGLLSGCMARLSYSFADWIIEWMVTDYVSLDKAQKKQLKVDIDEHLAWHKQTQVALYRDWLIEFKVQAETGLDREWLRAWSEQLTVFWQSIALQINADAIAFLRSLSDEQVQELIANLDKSQEEYIEQYLDPEPEKRLKERQERAEDFTKRLLGKLNDEQKQLIQDWNRQSGDSTALWLDNRERWTRRFEQALAFRNSEQFEDEITLLFVYQEKLWSDEYLRSVERNVESGLSLVLDIQPTVTEKQRRKLNKNLDKWIKLLDELSR